LAAPFVFNALDPETRRDPYALYARGRSEFPLHVHDELPLPVFSIFLYDDVQTMLRDDTIWSSEFAEAFTGTTVADETRKRQESMIGLDGKPHHRLRGLVNKAFTPRVVQRREAQMRASAAALVDIAVETGEVDLVEALTHPFPVQVIAEIIGVPPDDRERFKVWSDRAVSNLGTGFFENTSEEDIAAGEQLFGEMRNYFIPLAEARRKNPQDDLLTGLVQAEHEGSHLDHAEMLSMLILLLVAGNETTTTLIGNAALELMSHPDQMQRLRADSSLMPGAIEEVLRFASPVQFDPRRAVNPTSLHGHEIPENAIVLGWIGSANRDEKISACPDVFDISRQPNPHISFGFGVHFCLGSNLARLEAQIAIETLLAKTSLIERTDDEPLPLHESPVFRAAAKIPVRLEPA
jgi:cytochrome P450